ncbi:MAG: hypothetical protein ACR5LA_08200 [Wolbachia sp.]
MLDTKIKFHLMMMSFQCLTLESSLFIIIKMLYFNITFMLTNLTGSQCQALG